MKPLFSLTLGILIFALCLTLLPAQHFNVMAEPYDDEQIGEQMVDETPESDEEPMFDEEPLSDSEDAPMMDEEPFTDEPPMFDEEPLTDEPMTDEEPMMDDEPVAEDEPTLDDEPVTDEAYRDDSSGTADFEDMADEHSSPQGLARDTDADTVSAPAVVRHPKIPPKCSQAAGHAMYKLSNSTFGGYVSYMQPNATLSFHNISQKAFQVRITPASMVTKSNFIVPAGHKIDIFTTSSTQFMSGSIIANDGSGDRVQDLVKCP